MVTKEKKKESCGSNEELLPVRMPNLPDVIIVEEILSRLPVKSLIGFRSVCKSWNSLIASDPHFATLQFNNSMKNKKLFDHRRVLLCNGSSAFFLDKKASTNNDTFTVERLNFPVKGCSSIIVASCDGLVCIKNNNNDKNNNVLLFWNSLTGETKTVLEEPPTNISSLSSLGGLCELCDFEHDVTYGLGYDSSSEDYKLVRIYSSYHTLAESRVYSLRTNSWRLIESFPEKFTSHEPGVFVNGALYWAVLCGHYSDPGKVISFDLAKEKHRFLDIPEPRFPWSYKRVGVLGEKLCLCFLSGREGHELWLTNEHEDVESWAKYTINTPGGPWIMTPLCLLKNGEEDEDQFLLAATEGKLGLYNLRDGTFIRYLQVPGMLEKFQTVTFLETLFSPNTYNGINN